MLSNYSKNVQKALKNVKVGDKIKIIRGKSTYEGILLPRAELGDKDCIVLKLSNGYNIGIKYSKNIKIQKEKITTKEIPEEAKMELGKWKAHIKKKMEFDPSKPTITILHTGGTIASRIDYRTGAVVSSFTPEDIVGMFPELVDIANIKSRLIANMWSDDMRFSHYQKIAKEIEKEIKSGVDGIIITHGTDTLHYTSAALSFMIQNSPVPIILVGSQRSSDRPSSDAYLNLLSAAKFIQKGDFAGIAVCMHESSSDADCLIFPGTKCRKMHSSKRDAFKAINAKPIAKVNYENGKIEFYTSDYLRKDKKRKAKIKTKMENKVAIFKIYTNMYPDIFDFFSKANYKGIVIEGTGLGHMPLHSTDKDTEIHKKIANSISKLCKKSVVVMTTQTIFGRVGMNVYNKGRDLQNLGVIPGEDMTSETAFIKLSWLIGNFGIKKAKNMINKNLVGEISKRSEIL